MENAISNSKMKASKVRTSNENVSPLRIELEDKRGRYLQSTTMSPRFQPYAENIDVGSPLARYLFAGSPITGKVASSGEAFTPPTFGSGKYRSAKALHYSGNSSFGSRSRLSLSSIENLEIMSPPVYGTPVKVDEEILVMDDILVRPVSGDIFSKSSSIDLEEESNKKNPHCSQDIKFAHGKEELHPSHFSMKSKLSIRARPFIYSGQSSRTAAAASAHLVTTSQPASPEPHNTRANSNTTNDWSPLDDGIQVVLPNGSDKAPSREEVNAHIFSVLNNPTTGRRLPVFAALCEGQ
ncbi:zinc finger protein [Sesbania bispinosa]|nr:zinc finger protein [Sesbania bispinosa]